MIALAVIFACVASALAGEQHVAVSQDTLGNYNLKYAIDGISRVEHGDQLGNVNGGYSYIDPHGILRKTEFTSGVHGFNAVGTDIPLPVLDTPEVAHAKAKHLSVLHAESLRPKILEFQGPEEAFLAPVAPIGHFNHFLPAPVARFEHIAPALVAPAHLPIPALPSVAPFARFAPTPLHLTAGPLPVPTLHHFGHIGIPETPEVLAARAEHFAAHAAVKSNLHL